MPIGSKRRDEDGRVFMDGRALRANAADPAGAPAPQGALAPKPSKWRKSAARALKDLEESPAFEPSGRGGSGFGGASDLWASDRAALARISFVLASLLAIVSFASLCIGVDLSPSFHDPVSVVRALGERLRLSVGHLLGLDYWTPLSEAEANAAIPGYADIVKRFDITVVTLVCGFLMSLSGMMYQNVFRNPIAAPSMLGVSAGVRLGVAVLVVAFGEAAATMQGQRYLLSYLGGLVVLLLVMGFSKLLAGKGRVMNVVDMLIAGSIISQFLAILSTYLTTYAMSDAEYELFFEIAGGMSASADWYSLVFLAAVVAVAVVPVFLLRFRLNAVAFDDVDARLMGVNPARLRVFALVMGTLMILAAQVHVGVISLVALVVPFLVRYVMGSEFGKQLVGNVLIGPMLLVVCQDICSLVPISGGLSLSVAVGFVALPVYVWIMAIGKRGWE